MIFESIEHAHHYASGARIEIVIYQNKVVDVSEFKNKHPGGLETIVKHISKDITKVYDEISSHKTKTAMKDLDEFTIGTIKLNEITHEPNKKETVSRHSVDLNKGILWQVFTKLNREQYLDFIHDPKHMINPPEAILFETSFLEFFTKTPWFIIPIIWGPLAIYNFHYAFMTLDFPFMALILLFLFGVFIWTIIEYVLHRFIFHIDEKLPDNRFALMLHFLLHGIHHAFPMDGNRLVFPPTAAYPLYRLISYFLGLLFGGIYPIIFAGVLTGYIIYDLTHYFIHHAKPTITYYKNLKQYHVMHHYKDPHLGFGVSNKLWDYVFNTVLK